MVPLTMIVMIARMKVKMIMMLTVMTIMPNKQILL